MGPKPPTVATARLRFLHGPHAKVIIVPAAHKEEEGNIGEHLAPMTTGKSRDRKREEVRLTYANSIPSGVARNLSSKW